MHHLILQQKSNNYIIYMQQDSAQSNQLEFTTENGENLIKDVKQITLKITNRKHGAQIYHNIHQQKREGPPNKKDFGKQGTVEAKIPARKEESSLKNEDNTKNKATPSKTKQVEKGKQAHIPLMPNQYHLVSHSQRDKIIKGSTGGPIVNEALRDSHRRQKVRSAYQNSGVRLDQISEHLQHIKGYQNNKINYNRRSHQASPSCMEPILKCSIQK